MTTSPLVDAPRAAPPPDEGIDAVVAAGLTGVAMVLAMVGGFSVVTDKVTSLGLVSVMPIVYWLGVAVAGAATVLIVRASGRGPSRLAGLAPALWLVVLHTAPSLAHHGPRNPRVYADMGLVRLVGASEGGLPPDPRLAWPGFYGALVPVVDGLPPTVLQSLVRLWPTLVVGLSAVLVAAVARRAYPTRHQVPALAALAHVVTSWTGQEQFSPQSTLILGSLAVVAVIESGPLRPRGSLSSVAPLLSRFGAAGGDRSEVRSTAAFVTLVVISLAAVVSHPVAPLVLGGWLMVLGLYGRRVAWYLLLIVAASAAAWTLVVAGSWPSTQGLGLAAHLAGVLPEMVPEAWANRQPGSGYQLVGAVRLWLGVTTLAAALVVSAALAANRYRHLRPVVPLSLLAGVSLVVAVVTGWLGGAGLPGLVAVVPVLAILLARLVTTVPSPARPVLLALVVVALTPAFLLVRYGGESYELASRVDRQAVEAAVDAVDDTTLVVVDNPYLPWGDQLIPGGTSLPPLATIRAEPTAAWLDQIRAELDATGYQRAVIVLTRSQSAWRAEAEGHPPASLDQVGRWLADRPEVQVLARGAEAWVFVLEEGGGA